MFILMTKNKEFNFWQLNSTRDTLEDAQAELRRMHGKGCDDMELYEAKKIAPWTYTALTSNEAINEAFTAGLVVEGQWKWAVEEGGPNRGWRRVPGPSPSKNYNLKDFDFRARDEGK